MLRRFWSVIRFWDNWELEKVILGTKSFYKNIFFKTNFVFKDTCKPNSHFGNLISACSDEYSALNYDKNYYAYNWLDYSSTYVPNSTFTDIYSAFQYTESSQINSYPTKGAFNTYLGGGYVFNMKGGDSALILNNTRILESLDWIDKQTAAVFVEFTLFNPNVNLFQYCQILFEILPSGNLVNSAQFNSIDLIDLNNSGLFTFKILMNLIYMIFIGIFMIVEIKQIVKLGRQYFCQFNNYLELIIIAFSWAAFSMYIYRLYSSYDIYKSIQTQKVANGGGLQSVFINLQYTINCDQLLSYFIGFCAAFGSLRFIKLLRFSKHIIVFLIAFKTSFKELISFGIVLFGIIWLSFVQAIYLIFNDQSNKFSSFLNTIATCFQIILGKFNSDTFFKTYSVLGPFIFIAYNICIVFIMVSPFITILIENYNLAREDQELDTEDPELFNYLTSALFCCKSTKVKDSPAYMDYWNSMPNTFEDYSHRIQKVPFLLNFKL